MAWNPWRTLRQLDRIEFTRAPIGRWRGLAGTDGTHSAIILHTRLLRRERCAVLAHELIHLERGIGGGHPDRVVRAREERWVDDEVARRLIPLDELVPWIINRGDDPTTVADIAEQWDTTVNVAECAAAMVRHPSRWTG